MNIGLIIYGSLDTVSGGYLYDRMLVEHLRKQGDSVEIFSLPWRNYCWHLSDNLRSELLGSVARKSFDLLLQDELNHPSLIRFNQRLQQRHSYPIVSIVHHLRSDEAHHPWQNAIYRQVEKRYLQTIDGFIFNSQSSRENTFTLLKGQRPFVVCPPAADHVFKKDIGQLSGEKTREEGPVQLLFLGNVIARKGILVLLKALRKLEKIDWRLTIAGDFTIDPKIVKKARQVADTSAMRQRISWLGKVPRDEIPQLYHRHDLFVLPSFFEGFGIVYLEAMGAGLPVIASAAGGAADFIRHGENGFLLPPGDSKGLSQFIRLLAEDKKLRRRMSLAAWDTFLKHPGWAENMSNMRGFLSDIIKKGKDHGRK